MSSFTSTTTMPALPNNIITETFACGHSRSRHDLASGPHASAFAPDTAEDFTLPSNSSVYFGAPTILAATGTTVTAATVSSLPQLYTNGPCPLPACQSHDFAGLADVVVQPEYSVGDKELVKKYYGLYFEGEERWWALNVRVQRLHGVTRRTLDGLYLPQLAEFVTTFDGHTGYSTMSGEPIRVACTTTGYNFEEIEMVLARMDQAIDNRSPAVTFISNAIRAKTCLTEMEEKLGRFGALVDKFERIQRHLRKANLLWEPSPCISELTCPSEVTPEFLRLAGMNVGREKVAMAVLMPGITDWAHVAVPELNVDAGLANTAQDLPTRGPWTASVNQLFAASRVNRRAGFPSMHVSPTDMRPWGRAGVQVGEESAAGVHAADDEASSGSEELGYRKEAANASLARDFDYLEY